MCVYICVCMYERVCLCAAIFLSEIKTLYSHLVTGVQRYRNSQEN